MIAMAQAGSFLAAFMDGYETDFTGDMVVFLVSALPFLLQVAFFARYDMERFMFRKVRDMLMFAASVSTEVLFQVNLNYILPESIAESETIFKAIMTPLALIIFVAFLNFRFEKSQIYTIVFTVGLALMMILI